MIETVPRAPFADTGYEIMRSEILSANVRVCRVSKSRDADYPRLRFEGRHAKARLLGPVAVRSVFRFRYNPAPYQVEFTIRRQWTNALAMGNQRNEPTTTFGITVYGEHWGDTRASELAKTSEGWGSQLEHLFVDTQNRPHNFGMSGGSPGEERTRELINVIHDIRQVLCVAMAITS
jgi:hypothetical protein